MGRHLQRELEKLKKRVLSLSAFVEERVRLAITSSRIPNVSAI